MVSDTLKQLLQLLADGEFHSGTELSQTLGISRTSIWKHLQTLSELGLEYVAVTGKGYRLTQALQLLDLETVRCHLSERSQQLLQGFEIHDVLDSTNAYLMQLARNPSLNRQVCVAEHQTAGRGRRGRQWVSPFGHNLYLSVLWRYQRDPSSVAGLSLAIGVAVMRALKRLGIDGLGLKWPNDIYYRQQKLGGILLEVSGESSGPCHVVVGLGLNLFLAPAQSVAIQQPWTDLATVAGADIGKLRNQLLAWLVNEIVDVLADYDNCGLNAYLDPWRAYDCLYQQAVTLSIGEQVIEGTVAGIDDNGFLLLMTPDGVSKRYASGEVSVKIR